MKCWRFFIVPILAAGLLFVACGGGGSDGQTAPQATEPPAGAVAQPGVTVVEVNLAFPPPRFRPDPVIIKVGEPVQFKITSVDTKHTFTLGALGIDETIPQTRESIFSPVVIPREVGEFLLFCRIHVRLPMEGTVVVTE